MADERFEKGDEVRFRAPTPVPHWRGVVTRAARDGSWADVRWTTNDGIISRVVDTFRVIDTARLEKICERRGG